ncbi:MAG: amidohydrolase, partial [Longimicrobiales bacterium]
MLRTVVARALILWLPLLGVAVAPAVARGQEQVDLILHNGRIFTADDLVSIRSSVAVRGDRIVAVGGPELLQRYRAGRVIDLRGRLVTPGFNDTHIHVSGEARRHVDLSRLTSIDAIKDAIRRKASELRPGEWITGYGWAEGLVTERRPPLRSDLDAAAPQNPVVISRAGGHSVVGNSLALQLAKIDRATPQPEGGVIERGADGEPNGIIRERLDLLGRLVPPAPPAELRPSFIAKLKELLSLGITSIIAAGVPPRAYEEWDAVYRMHRGELPRATVQIFPGLEKGGATAAEAVRRIQAFGKKTGEGDEWLRVGAVKLWVDGGFAGPAAWTLEPYRNQPSYFGIQNIAEQDLEAVV